MEIADAETSIKEKGEELHNIERKSLPELFSLAGITSLTIEKEGNMPAFTAERAAYYRANIAASWPEEKREAAFKWLESNGGGDLIKCEISVFIPNKQKKTKQMRNAVLAVVKKLKLEHSISLAVHASTLTAFVRESVEKRKKVPPLELLGADVGDIVRLKPKKE